MIKWILILSWSVVFIDSSSPALITFVAWTLGIGGVILGTYQGLRDTAERVEAMNNGK